MMKRSYLSGLLIAVLMMVCSVSLASEAPSSGYVPAFEVVAMDTGQPVTSVAALASAYEQHNDYKHTGPGFKSMSAAINSGICRSSSGGIVLIACNTGKYSNYLYAMTTRSMPTLTKVPI